MKHPKMQSMHNQRGGTASETRRDETSRENVPIYTHGRRGCRHQTSSWRWTLSIAATLSLAAAAVTDIRRRRTAGRVVFRGVYRGSILILILILASSVQSSPVQSSLHQSFHSAFAELETPHRVWPIKSHNLARNDRRTTARFGQSDVMQQQPIRDCSPQ